MTDRTRGLTLLELLISLSIIGVVSAAAMQAYVFGATYTGRTQASRDEQDRTIRFERLLTDLISSAVITTAEAPDSYFIGGQINTGSLQGSTPEGLVFTARGSRVPAPILRSEEDFETQNAEFGPQGGTAEVALSLTPVGSAPAPTGLFLREQRPPDGDPTQGGFESSLHSEVVECTFEFFDGASWLTEWDTRESERRLPAAVRVTYRLEGAAEPRTFVVRIPTSDVTAESPLGSDPAGGGA